MKIDCCKQPLEVEWDLAVGWCAWLDAYWVSGSGGLL